MARSFASFRKSRDTRVRVQDRSPEQKHLTSLLTLSARVGKTDDTLLHHHTNPAPSPARHESCEKNRKTHAAQPSPVTRLSIFLVPLPLEKDRERLGEGH